MKLQQQGVNIVGDEGSVEGHKVEISFFYNGFDTLTLYVKHKPFYYPEDKVEEEIRNWFNG